MKPVSPEEALLKLLWSIREYLSEIVIIGGWVPHLYRQYGGFSAWSAELSFTYEMDVLVDRSLPPRDRAPLAKLLEAAGSPAWTWYLPDMEDSTFASSAAWSESGSPCMS